MDKKLLNLYLQSWTFHSQELDRLCDSLVEDIFSATDEDILNEAAEDYSNPDSAVAFVRSTIGKARHI